MLKRFFMEEPKYGEALHAEEVQFAQEGTTDLLTLWPEVPLIEESDRIAYAKEYLKVTEGITLFPDCCRPLLHLLGVVRKLAYLEVFLAVLCTSISFAGFAPVAQVLVCCGFIIVLKLKMHAIRTLLCGPEIKFRDGLENFLEGENFKMVGVSFPFRRYIGITLVSMPTFMEATFTGIALPVAYARDPYLATASGVLLVVSLVLQLYGTRLNLWLARYSLMMTTGDVMRGCNDIMASCNLFWHYVTMAAAMSNLTMISACAGKLCDETMNLEHTDQYKASMHCGSSQGSRVWIKAVLTGCPRVMLNIEILRGEVNVSDRLHMLLAIACTMVGLVQMLQTAIYRTMNQTKVLKALQPRYPHLKVADAFLKPWHEQYCGSRAVPGDSSVYVVCLLTLQLFFCLARLQQPIQELVLDILH